MTYSLDKLFALIIFNPLLNIICLIFSYQFHMVITLMRKSKVKMASSVFDDIDWKLQPHVFGQSSCPIRIIFSIRKNNVGISLEVSSKIEPTKLIKRILVIRGEAIYLLTVGRILALIECLWQEHRRVWVCNWHCNLITLQNLFSFHLLTPCIIVKTEISLVLAAEECLNKGL